MKHSALTESEDDRPMLLPGLALGEAPGSAVYTGDDRVHDVEVRISDFTPETFEEMTPKTAEEAALVRGRPTVSWVDVNGIHDVDLVRRLCAAFNVHPLSMEDILNPRQRAKVEYYDEYVYLVVKMVHVEDSAPVYEQVSLLLGTDYVMTFQERPKDVFDPVRQRLRNVDSRERRRGADYLAYSLMDAVVDNYVVVLETIGRRVEEIENGEPTDFNRSHPPEFHDLKQELLTLRKAVWPMREAVSALIRNESGQIQKTTEPYLRDLFDHLIQIVESIDIYREMLSSLQDLYLTIISNRMNEEMRLLTVIATIFIPMTFVAGVYGMNFDVMPELRWKYGYLTFWSAMLGVGVMLFFHFKRRGWL